MDKYQAVLEQSLQAATKLNEAPEIGISASVMYDVDMLVGWRYRSPLMVLLTSLVKKSVDPKQDIRMHRSDLPDGYSGRGFDTSAVTPFLNKNGFPHMASGSGWLTRSFEQAHPFNLDYPGRISGKGIKDAFLKTIDAVEREVVSPRPLIEYVLWRLIRRREKESVALSKPTNLTIAEIVSYLARHFECGGPGKARLPVLAIYAVYQQMVGGEEQWGDVSRYKHKRLLSLASHTSADSKSGATGDIEVTDPEHDTVFESVEIKHG